MTYDGQSVIDRSDAAGAVSDAIDRPPIGISTARTVSAPSTPRAPRCGHRSPGSSTSSRRSSPSASRSSAARRRPRSSPPAAPVPARPRRARALARRLAARAAGAAGAGRRASRARAPRTRAARADEARTGRATSSCACPSRPRRRRLRRVGGAPPPRPDRHARRLVAAQLSSGCPLPRGSRPRRDPAPSSEHRSPASGADDRSSSRSVFFSDIGTCARNLRQRV